MRVSEMRAYRQLQGLSLYEVEAVTGISVSMLSLVEREYRRLNREDQEKVARALGCTVEVLFPMREREG